MTDQSLTAELLVLDLTEQERSRAERVESVLPALSARAEEADRLGEFPVEHVATMSEVGLLGLNVPVEYGGLGGGLRDLVAATFALGTACPSTAMAYFFECSGTSRGLLPLEAIEAGLFTDDEVPVVRAFAERLLRRMGDEGRWVANFASESAKSKDAKISIATEARRVDGGWVINGVKAFGCATGVADDYLVTAKLEGGTSAEHLAVFLVPRETEGVTDRTRWDALGMRASATHGIVLDDAFVPDDDALAVPGAFVKMTQVSRGSFVGNQMAAAAVYIGAAQSAYDFAINHLQTKMYEGTSEPIATDPVQLQIVGEMRGHLEGAMVWARNQLRLETSEPPIMAKDEEVAAWRSAKSSIAEHCMGVTTAALKACGTSNTAFGSPVSRAFRDVAMGLVQGFPPERGRSESAKFHALGGNTNQFGAR